MSLVSMEERDTFIKALARELADLNPYLGDDLDFGNFLVVPVGPQMWVRVEASQYGKVDIRETTDAVGSMVSFSSIAQGLEHTETQLVAAVIRELAEARHVGIEQARKELGPIVDAAHHRGEVTYLTRHGHPYAAVVPIGRVAYRHPFEPAKHIQERS